MYQVKKKLFNLYTTVTVLVSTSHQLDRPFQGGTSLQVGHRAKQSSGDPLTGIPVPSPLYHAILAMLVTQVVVREKRLNVQTVLY